MSDARDALMEALGDLWCDGMACDEALDALPAVTFPDECPTCRVTHAGDDWKWTCPECGDGPNGSVDRNALAAFAVESNPEAVIEELVRQGRLEESGARALPDEVQTGTEEPA